jgi:hypothetical protein
MELPCLTPGCITRFGSIKERTEHEEANDHYIYLPSTASILGTYLEDHSETFEYEGPSFTLEDQDQDQDQEEEVNDSSDENHLGSLHSQTEMSEEEDGDDVEEVLQINVVENIITLDDIPEPWISLWGTDIGKSTRIMSLLEEWATNEMKERPELFRAAYTRTTGTRSMICKELFPNDFKKVSQFKKDLLERFLELKPKVVHVCSTHGEAKAEVEIAINHPAIPLSYLLSNPSLEKEHIAKVPVSDDGGFTSSQIHRDTAEYVAGNGSTPLFLHLWQDGSVCGLSQAVHSVLMRISNISYFIANQDRNTAIFGAINTNVKISGSEHLEKDQLETLTQSVIAKAKSIFYLELIDYHEKGKSASSNMVIFMHSLGDFVEFGSQLSILQSAPHCLTCINGTHRMSSNNIRFRGFEKAKEDRGKVIKLFRERTTVSSRKRLRDAPEPSKSYFRIGDGLIKQTGLRPVKGIFDFLSSTTIFGVTKENGQLYNIPPFQGIRFDTLHCVESLVEDAIKHAILHILNSCHQTKAKTKIWIHKLWEAVGRTPGLSNMPKTRHGSMSQCTPNSILLLLAIYFLNGIDISAKTKAIQIINNMIVVAIHLRRFHQILPEE